MQDRRMDMGILGKWASKAIMVVPMALSLQSAPAQSYAAPATPPDDANGPEVAEERAKRGLSDEPVQWVADMMAARVKTSNPALDSQITQDAIQKVATDPYFYDGIAAAVKSGRLLQIRETDRQDGLLPAAADQYRQLAEEIEKKHPQKPIRILVDTQDNDLFSKMNLIITPPGSPHDGENYLIISEGAHKWSADYVSSRAVSKSDLSADKNSLLLFSEDGRHKQRGPAVYSAADDQLRKEMRKVANLVLGKGSKVPDIYLDLTDKNDKDAVPKIVVFLTKEGEPVVALNSRGREMIKLVNQLDGVGGHELSHYALGDLDFATVADNHNLPFGARIQHAQFLEDRADANSVLQQARGSRTKRNKLAKGLATVIEDADRQLERQFDRDYPGVTHEDFVETAKTFTDHGPAETRIPALEQATGWKATEDRRRKGTGTYRDRKKPEPAGSFVAAETGRDTARTNDTKQVGGS